MARPDKIGQRGGSVIGDQCHVLPRQPCCRIALAQARPVLGRDAPQRRAQLGQFFRLDLVQTVLLAQHQADRLFIASHHPMHRDPRAVGRPGRDLCHGACGRGPRIGGRQGHGQLHVGGIVALSGEGDGVFPGVRQHMELMGETAADAS